MRVVDKKGSFNYVISAYEKYRDIFHKGSMVMLVIDPETGSIIDANKAASNFYGYSTEELKQMNISQINVFSKEEIKARMGFVVNSGEEHFCFKHRLADGTIRDVEVHSGFVEDINKNIIFSIIYDITESKRNAERFLVAEDIANIGSWEYNLNTKRFYASRGAQRITGISSEEITTEQLLAVSLAEYRTMLVDSLKKLIYEGKPYDIEFKVFNQKEGGVLDLRSVARYRKGSDTVTGIINDITARKKIEKDLWQAKEKAEESDRLKSAFLATVSHELRTPLNAIIGLSDLIKEGSDVEEMQEMNAIIHSSGNKLLDIIDTILDISLIETNKYEINKERFTIADIKKSISNVLDLDNKPDSKVVKRFKPQGNPENISLYSDFYMLKKVLNSLLNNAIKFTEKGFIDYGYVISNNNIVFFVKDTGPGIPDDKKETIFESFRQLDETVTRRYEGIGLGLTVCKRIADVLGAKLWVESEQGMGSVFYFKLEGTDIKYS